MNIYVIFHINDEVFQPRAPLLLILLELIFLIGHFIPCTQQSFSVSYPTPYTVLGAVYGTGHHYVHTYIVEVFKLFFVHGSI